LGGRKSIGPVPHIQQHSLNGPLSGTTQENRYQKGKTNLDFTGARDSEWQWYQLGHMQICTSLQKNNHASTPPLSFFTGRMPFLPPNQQCQSTEGKIQINKLNTWFSCLLQHSARKRGGLILQCPRAQTHFLGRGNFTNTIPGLSRSHGNPDYYSYCYHAICKRVNTISVCNKPTRSTQLCIPPGSLNRVPASAGVRTGMSALSGGR